MSTASQNYIIPEINSNKYINNNMYHYDDKNNNHGQVNSSNISLLLL